MRSKFKTGPKVTTRAAQKLQSKMSLTPVAQMVYDSTSIGFSYPTPPPSSPSKLAKSKPASQRQKPSSNSKPDTLQHETNREAHRQNSTTPSQSHKPKPKLQQVEVDGKRRVSQNQEAYDQNSSITVDPKHPRTGEEHDPNSTIIVHTPTKRTDATKPKSQTATPPEPSAPRSSNSKFAIVIPPPPKDISTPAPILPPPRQYSATVDHLTQTSGQPNLSQSPSGSNPNLLVVIPGPTSNFRPEEYEVLPDSPATPQNLSKKRKRVYADGFHGDISMTVDQRQQADQAFKGLGDYFREIFEAEYLLNPDTMDSNNVFISTNDGFSLSAPVQVRVEGLLHKIIDLGRFSQVPLDELLRLQKLGDGALKDAENADVKVDDAMGESEVDNMVQQLSVFDVGLKSARTSLRMMSGGREDRQLYSEDVISTALKAFKNVTENCIIPIVEMRSSGPSADVFRLLVPHKKTITNILTICKKVLSLIATLLANIELSETVINTLEFTASRLIFVENAHIERDSVIGIAKFDNFRVVAMDALAQIFLNHPAQRTGIFDEILTSLEKLPVTKQSARHFKLADGGSIQLVSALIMRLIQTCASRSDDSKQKRRAIGAELLGDDQIDTANGIIKSHATITSEDRAEQQVVTAIQELTEVTSQLLDNTKANASYVVSFIVGRAMKSTKSGDAPYRNLLDLFVDDFITCLRSPDWPAAELLLRLLMFKMVQLAEGDNKVPTPAKNMALDLLGSMGAAISQLRSHVKSTAATFQNDDADLGKWMARLADASLDRVAAPVDLVSWDCGPYRTTLEYLERKCSDDPQLSSAVSYFVAEWGSKVSTTYDNLNEDDYNYQATERLYGRLAYRLRMMITDKRWLSTEYSYELVNPAQARLAYSLTLLHSNFCESFGRVFNILVGSMASEQATVRSKSIKSVNQVLETDPSILDREPAVKHFLLKCANDSSIQVRDNALAFIGNCIKINRSFEQEMIPSILARVNDAGVGVRKRAMKLCKEIYLDNQDKHVRSAIAESLLHRVTDQDEGVQELARQTIEDVWMSPFYKSTSSDASDTRSKLAMADHVSLMVRTVQRGNGVGIVLDKVLQGILSSNSRQASANFKVCKALVATMFETIIDNSASEGQDAPSARDALEVLMIFAKSDPKLFTPEQVILLQPYITNVGGQDDLMVFRSVVVIFRHVLPQLSKVHNNFLASVRKELMQLVSKMTKVILDDMAACLWIISSVLNDFQHLARLVLSSVNGVRTMIGMDLTGKPAFVTKLRKLLVITGIFGKHCNLDSQIDMFREKCPGWKGDSVAKFMADSAAPFASPSQPLDVRSSAFDAIGMICQSWPKNFNSVNISTSFKEAFSEQNVNLEYIIMKSFKDFYFAEEKRSVEASKEGTVGAAVEGTAKLGVMGGSSGDGIAIGIAQLFLSEFTRIALASQDDQALLATELITSITRQGLVHPKECGTTLIALETSRNPKIADLAFRAHRTLHEKHETILEREYMRAVHRAFVYQRDVVKDIHGANLNPFVSKLSMMIEVLKISAPKNRKRFFEGLCERIDFDPLKMNLEELPEHLDFSEFIIENMAFFEYKSVDELLAAIAAMEKVVAGAGTGVAHAIETEVLNVTLNQQSEVDANGQIRPVEHVISPNRLMQLAASSMMLSCLWEARSYLRRQYGLKIIRPEGKSKQKGGNKERDRAPTKVAFVTGDKFWEEVTSTMSALESEEAMIKQCKSFVELLSVDQDFKIAAEGDEGQEARLGTPSEDEDDDAPNPPSGGGRGNKRKGSSTPGGRKKRARSSSVSRGRVHPKGSGKRSSIDPDGDE